ncbi:MAG: OmpA family protein [Burkholderiales bacterium]|nr:OmpA family protein [Burkholderiales bacterium]
MIRQFAMLGIFAAALPALAQTDIRAGTPNSAYVQDGRGVITRSGAGLCWRTGYWTPADAVPGCDGPLVAPVAEPSVPAIAPVVQAPPPAKPVAPKRCDFAVTLQNDETFDFNKAALKSGAKQRIDNEVLSKLAACAKVELVIVTGHTDLIGSHPYNQKLSEKRADAVAAYLKDKGVSANIDTMGMGKTQQIKACDDKLPRAKLAACLAPNRRVVVEGRGLAK